MWLDPYWARQHGEGGLQASLVGGPQLFLMLGEQRELKGLGAYGTISDMCRTFAQVDK